MSVLHTMEMYSKTAEDMSLINGAIPVIGGSDFAHEKDLAESSTSAEDCLANWNVMLGLQQSLTRILEYPKDGYMTVSLLFLKEQIKEIIIELFGKSAKDLFDLGTFLGQCLDRESELEKVPPEAMD